MHYLSSPPVQEALATNCYNIYPEGPEGSTKRRGTFLRGEGAKLLLDKRRARCEALAR